jgi:cell division protein ZapA
MGAPVEVEILGQRLTVASDDGEEHVRQVAGYVEAQMQRLAHGRVPAATVHLALVTALNIASDYRKLQDQHEELYRTISRLTQRVLARLAR